MLNPVFLGAFLPTFTTLTRQRSSQGILMIGLDGSGPPVPKMNKTETYNAKVNGLSQHGRLSAQASLPEALVNKHHLRQLYSSSATAKIWGVAQRDLRRREPPDLYPEYTKPGDTSYVYRELNFWTSGFFPGSLHLLLERQRKYRYLLHPPSSSDAQRNLLPHPLQLEFACKWWTENLHGNAILEGTHDLGFMIAPWACLQWELNHDRRSLDTILTAADTLASRFSDTVGCIRSWDTCETRAYSFKDPSTDFLVIIDNMINLDLLFWAAAFHPSPTRSAALHAIAVSHARTTQRHHVAADSSTTHVVNFDSSTGSPKAKLTNQGHAHDSCWARGQAWAIAGFAQAHAWTADDSFLATARECADYFLRRLPDSLVPPWDFDAPAGNSPQPRDTSAGLIAAYGMLLVHEALVLREGSSKYLDAALRIVDAVCGRHLNGPAVFEERGREVETVERGLVAGLGGGTVAVRIGGGDTIVNGATINNYEFAPRRWVDHGLVYADYFFLLLGNKLLDMGVGREILRSAPE